MVDAWVLPGFQSRLCHHRLEHDVLHGGDEAQIDLAADEVTYEGPLDHGLRGRGDRGVEGVPVDEQSKISSQILEDLLIDGGQFLTQFDEVAA